MRPLFQKGDLLVVERIAPSAIHKGDIVSYPDPLHPAVTISHRVVAVDYNSGRMVTKGDANLTADPQAPLAVAVGVVRYSVPKAGWAVDALKSWQGIVVAVYLPAFVLVVHELRRLGREYLSPTYSLRR